MCEEHNESKIKYLGRRIVFLNGGVGYAHVREHARVLAHDDHKPTEGRGGRKKWNNWDHQTLDCEAEQ